MATTVDLDFTNNFLGQTEFRDGKLFENERKQILPSLRFNLFGGVK